MGSLLRRLRLGRVIRCYPPPWLLHVPARDLLSGRCGRRGIWLRGNERLGVVEGSAVDPVVFDRLCEGCDADGNKLVKTPIFKRRMLGVDITLSSPKSVSVLYAVGDPALRVQLQAPNEQRSKRLSN